MADRCAPRSGALSEQKRDRLPDRAFGLVEFRNGHKIRKYPMPDVSHAKNAKARATQQLAAGNLSRAEYRDVVRKADRIISSCAGNRAHNPGRSNMAEKNETPVWPWLLGGGLLALGVVVGGAIWAYRKAAKEDAKNGDLGLGKLAVMVARQDPPIP